MINLRKPRKNEYRNIRAEDDSKMDDRSSKRSKLKDALRVVSVNIGIKKLHTEDDMDHYKAKNTVLWLEAGFDGLRHMKKRIFSVVKRVFVPVAFIILLLRGRKRKRNKQKR